VICLRRIRRRAAIAPHRFHRREYPASSQVRNAPAATGFVQLGRQVGPCYPAVGADAASALPQEDHMSDYKVGYFIGSLAKDSINRKLANALVRLAPSELEMREISFRDLPLYSYDYDSD